MANIVSKQIIAGQAVRFEASINWTNLDDVNTWTVQYKYYDVSGTVIKEGTQPVPLSALSAAGMTMTIANNIRLWVATQAGVTLA